METQPICFHLEMKNYLEFKKLVKKEFQSMNGKINELVRKYIEEKRLTK